MDGSVDKNTELRLSLLYFVDEAIGYRHSLHFLRRWLETEEQSELEGLIAEVGRENFVDLTPIVATVKDPANTAGMLALNDFIKQFGIFSPEDEDTSIVRIEPLPDLDNTILENLEGNNWAMHNWVQRNTYENRNPFYTIASAFGLLNNASNDSSLMFKLFEQMFGKDVTLFSAILNDDIQLLGDILSLQYYPSEKKYIDKLVQVIIENPDLNWKDALSRNQIKSKLWLIDKMNELKVLPKRRPGLLVDPTNVLLVGGWVGILPFLADMKGKFLDTVTNIDIDETVHSASMMLNSDTVSTFRTNGKDVRELNIAKYSKPIVIDTIVEHFEDHGEWVKTLPATATVVLQGNDMFDVPEHVNCHKTLEEFIESCGLNNIIWAGELNLYKCTRYMAIGTT
jgi:hypothetical protein